MNEQKKECPMKINQAGYPNVCTEKVCGFWDEEDKRCAIVTLAKRPFFKINDTGIGIEP